MEWALEEAHDGEALGTLVASVAPGRGDREGEWLVWAISSAVPTCDDSCGEGGISFREARFIFPGSERVSSPLAVGTSGAMDIGAQGVALMYQALHLRRVPLFLSSCWNRGPYHLGTP